MLKDEFPENTLIRFACHTKIIMLFISGGGDGQAKFFSKMDELLDGNAADQHEAFTTLKIYKDKVKGFATTFTENEK